MTVFLRLLAEDDKPRALLEACSLQRAVGGGESAADGCPPPPADGKPQAANVFEVDPKAFAQVPGSPFAYWVSDRLRELFFQTPPFESTETDRVARIGAGTNDDFRFLRLWFEVQADQEAWPSLAKGGVYSLFYASLPLVIEWRRRGAQLKASCIHNGDSPSRNIRSESEYFRPGLTWPLRTQSGFGIRAMPAGCIFGHKGPAALVTGDDPESLLALLAITTSAPFRYLVELQMAFGSYEVGVIQRTPVPLLAAGGLQPAVGSGQPSAADGGLPAASCQPQAADSSRRLLADLARRAWSLKRTLDTVNETSHAFVLPAALRRRAGPFDPAAIAAELAQIQADIDDHAFALYGIADADRAEIERWAGKAAEAAGGDEDGDEPGEAADSQAPAAGHEALLSWAVGVAFGRFDPRLATGERPPPAEPGPFDPLPPRSPGMMPDDSRVRAVLVDDPGHRDDLAAAVLAVLESAGVADDGHPEACRAWLAKAFFPQHLKQYSKSRRKAPIYWQLATPSAGYSVWLYLHGFDQDTLYQVQNDYAAPKLAHEERKLEALRAELGASPAAAGRRALAAQEGLVEELRGFLEEVKRVAPLWHPALDDGVVINCAPLWRLAGHCKPWQKELKAVWDSLCAGEYDWAHGAMRLWPERVAPQCAADRSLAIAHGLEDLFWVEDYAGRWRRRVAQAETVAYLEQHWQAAGLAETVAELEAFWQGHGDDPSWWDALAGGVHDDHPLALALWPGRVLEKCLADEKLFKAHGLTGKTAQGRGTPLEKLLRQYPARHTAEELRRLAGFCGFKGGKAAWPARWAAFAEGSLDREPLALRVHARRVIAQALEDYEFAALHDVARWFWLATPAGPRRLAEPEAELSREVKERESAAVKAALRNLLEASQPANPQRTPKQKRHSV